MKGIKTYIGDILLLFIICVMIIPFIYMVITSFKVTYSAYNFKISLSDLTLENYKIIFKNHNFLQYFINSTVVVFGACILNVLFSSLAGYAFAKLEFKGRDKIFFTLLTSLMIPSQAIMIPVYLIMKKIGWINTYQGLIMPLITAFGVFLMRQTIINIPRDLIDSARIDGCSEIRIFFHIILPIIKPAIIALSIFTFMSAWNDFLWPLIMTTKDSTKTLTLGLSALNTEHRTNYGLVMAGATLTFLPPFIFYIILQKKFVKGVTLSGLKG